LGQSLLGVSGPTAMFTSEGMLYEDRTCRWIFLARSDWSDWATQPRQITRRTTKERRIKLTKNRLSIAN
jgi:hypothetical protein